MKMAPGKTRKSVLKRIKITKNKRLLRRVSGVNHFLAKKPRDLIRNKRNFKDFEDDLIKKYLNY